MEKVTTLKEQMEQDHLPLAEMEREREDFKKTSAELQQRAEDVQQHLEETQKLNQDLQVSSVLRFLVGKECTDGSVTFHFPMRSVLLSQTFQSESIVR